MEEIVILEWSYTPVDFFEEPISMVEAGYELHLDHGKVEAKVKAEYFDNHQELLEQIETRIKSKFMGVQLINIRSYSLSRPTETRTMPNGIRNIKLTVQSASMRATACSSDIIAMDKDGNVTADTKRDRIYHQNQLADLINKHGPSNPLVYKLMASYRTAIEDPGNALVHLYEIRDALSNEFGGGDKVNKALNIDHKKWSNFGYLANKAPLKQGRHRGKYNNLRDTTVEELQEAMDFSFSLIEEYLQYLEAHQP